MNPCYALGFLVGEGRCKGWNQVVGKISFSASWRTVQKKVVLSGNGDFNRAGSVIVAVKVHVVDFCDFLFVKNNLTTSPRSDGR